VICFYELPRGVELDCFWARELSRVVLVDALELVLGIFVGEPSLFLVAITRMGDVVAFGFGWLTGVRSASM
jgi:hypothetical protein